MPSRFWRNETPGAQVPIAVIGSTGVVWATVALTTRYGRLSPARRANLAACAPAALITTGAKISPRSV
ncbi:hypothetical protein BH23CHL2_BH23CHL2_33830 [soil metagenome]